MVSMATDVSNALTESCNTANSSSAACGNTSGLTLIICPALMYVGPSFSMIILASFANALSFLLNSALPPVMASVATFVKNGTLRLKNSPHRRCNAPPCLSQYF